MRMNRVLFILIMEHLLELLNPIGLAGPEVSLSFSVLLATAFSLGIFVTSPARFCPRGHIPFFGEHVGVRRDALRISRGVSLPRVRWLLLLLLLALLML